MSLYSALRGRVEAVLETQPDLNPFGFGTFGQRQLTAAERAAELARLRDEAFSPRCLDEFRRASEWLALRARTKSFSRLSSYSWKHIAEHEIGYVSNGMLIMAALDLGFKIRRDLCGGPNCIINISTRGIKRVRSGCPPIPIMHPQLAATRDVADLL